MFLKSFKNYAAILLCMVTFVGCGETQEQKINSFNYDKKDYLSISKACDNGYLNACINKYHVDVVDSPDVDFYKNLCDKGNLLSCRHYNFYSFILTKDEKYREKACRLGDLFSCQDGLDNITLEQYQWVKEQSYKLKDDTFEANMQYIAHFYLKNRDEYKDYEYFEKVCKAGFVYSCYSLYEKSMKDDYDTTLVEYSLKLAKKQCKSDHEACLECLTYANITKDTHLYVEITQTLASKGMLYMSSFNDIAYKSEDERSLIAKEYKDFEKELIKNLKKGCKLGNTLNCDMANVVDPDKIVTPMSASELGVYIRYGKPLDKIDTSKITDMSRLFYTDGFFSKIDIDSFKGLENWNVSNVEKMDEMFYGVRNFDANLSKWDLSSVKSMKNIFEPNYYESIKDTINLPKNSFAFDEFSFYKALEIKNFQEASDVLLKIASLGVDTKKYFFDLSYEDNGEISQNKEFLDNLKKAYNGKSSFLDKLDEVVTPTTKEELLEYIRTGKPLDKINTSKITDMNGIFLNSKRKDFSGIESWDTSNVTSMNYMFKGAIYFNHDISKWNTKNVVSMNEMFYNCSDFNQPIGSWDVSSLKSAKHMFGSATSFNQNLSSWNVGKLRYADGMFAHARNFNQPIGSWNISKLWTANNMFYGCKKFNQDLSSWDLKYIYDFEYMLHDTPIQNDKSKHPKILE